MFYLLSIILLIIIVILIFIILIQKNNFEHNELDNRKKLGEINNKYSVCLKEKLELQKKLEGYKEGEKESNFTNNLIEEKDEDGLIYFGKKALVGDYFLPSSNNTKSVLESLGFEVDVVTKSEDVIEKIKSNEKYDIIFSNNIYRDGTGPECLKELKKIKGFNTPVIIHTVSINQEEYFINKIGFDGYIEKPVSVEKLKPILEKIFKN